MVNDVEKRTSGVDTDMVVGPTARGELLSLVNEAGVVLDGIVYSPLDTTRLVVVHVHGSLGNFYQQQFIRVIANHLTRHGVSLVSFNLTAHDGVSEGYTLNGDLEYIGGSLSKFETCLDDIDTILGFARSICSEVVLQGHSLGCDRVLFYTQHHSENVPLILLSPCDSHRLHETWLDGEQISQQVARLSRVQNTDGQISLLPAREYGLNGPEGWTYNIPINRDALISILTGPPFQILRLDSSTKSVSDAPAFIYLGNEDVIRGASLDEMVEHLRQVLPASRVHVNEHGDHDLTGCEIEVGEAILLWAYEEGLLTNR